MERGTDILTDPAHDMSSIGNLDAVSDPRWDPWGLASEPSYNDLLTVIGGNQEHGIDEIRGFIPDFTTDLLATDWTEPFMSQDSLPPQHSSESTSRGSFSAVSEYQLYSTSDELKVKKRRSSRKKSALVSPPADDLTSSHQQEIAADTYMHGTTNEAATLPSEANSYTKKVKERNRRAANKVRYRQREAEKSLESTEKDMGQVHRDLTARAQELNDEVQCLKLQLLEHVGCDCALIQEYIACEASRYIQDISKERSANH